MSLKVLLSKDYDAPVEAVVTFIQPERPIYRRVHIGQGHHTNMRSHTEPAEATLKVPVGFHPQLGETYLLQVPESQVCFYLHVFGMEFLQTDLLIGGFLSRV